MTPHQQWEYTVVQLTSPTLRGGVRVFAIDSVVQSDRDRTPSVHLHELLNEWGAAGWELVDISETKVLVFKRLRPADATESRTTRLPDYPGP